MLVSTGIIIIRHGLLRGLGRLTSLLLDLLSGGLGCLAHSLRVWHGDISFLRLVLTLVGINFVLSILLDEGGQVFDGTRALVNDGAVLLAGGEKFDGWEAGNLVWNVIGGGIYFGDGDLGIESRFRSVQFGKLLVFRSKTVYVSA